MKTNVYIILAFFIFISAMVITVPVYMLRMQDVGKATAERDNCLAYAQQYALDALDKFSNPTYRTEGVAYIDGDQISNVELYIKNGIASYCDAKSDVENLVVSNVSITQGSLQEEPSGVAPGLMRSVQGTYPSVTFKLSGDIKNVVKQTDGKTTRHFSAKVEVIMDNVSRNNQYRDTTNIEYQPYNNIY